MLRHLFPPSQALPGATRPDPLIPRLALRFSRQSEEEADAKGLQMLVAGHINPKGMIEMFETLKKQGDVPEYLEYFSTHPRTGERLRSMYTLATHDQASFPILFPELNWTSIASACRQRQDTLRVAP